MFNAPFDVAKSRAQSAAGGAGGRGPIQVLGDIIRTEGPGGIYKVSVRFMVLGFGFFGFWVLQSRGASTR